MAVELANEGSIPAVPEAPAEIEKLLSLSVERNGDTAVVTCHGRLIARSTDDLTRMVHPLLLQARIVNLDLANLSQVDCSGLYTLARLRASAREANCRLQTPHLGRQLRKRLTLRGVLSVFSQLEEHGITIA